jgi:hypothetical protein
MGINLHSSPSKRKTPVPSNPPAHNSPTTTVTVKSTDRNPSNNSIAGPTQDSAGGTRVWGSDDRVRYMFANNFLMYTVTSIWPDGIVLDWVKGREGDTELVWSRTYLSLVPPPLRHFASALTDGSIQIMIPDTQSPGGRSFWDQQSYAVPLEVSTPSIASSDEHYFHFRSSAGLFVFLEC